MCKEFPYLSSAGPEGPSLKSMCIHKHVKSQVFFVIHEVYGICPPASQIPSAFEPLFMTHAKVLQTTTQLDRPFFRGMSRIPSKKNKETEFNLSAHKIEVTFQAGHDGNCVFLV